MKQDQNKFSELSKMFEPELVKEIIKLPVFKFDKGFTFAGNTDEPNSIPIIIKGHINVSRKDKKGRMYPVYTINEGESCIIAINAVIHSSNNRGQKGIAGEDTETVVVSAEQSKIWINKYKSWRDYIFNLYSKRLNELLYQHEVVTAHNVSIITPHNGHNIIFSQITYFGKPSIFLPTL